VLLVIGLALATAPGHWRPKASVLDQAWGWARGCTQTAVPELPGRASLDSIHWEQFPPGALDDTVAGHVVGEWVWAHGAGPDTIYIDALHADTVWVIAHELVHHILGPTALTRGEAHPFIPFAFPCMLMDYQHGLALPPMCQTMLNGICIER
jgi:hypothetical protein